MKNFISLKDIDKKQLINSCSVDSKFGKHILQLNNSNDIYEQLKNLDVKYVIFGLPNDIRDFVKSEKKMPSSLFKAVIKVLLNTQNNTYNSPEKIAILGSVDFQEADLDKSFNRKNTSYKIKVTQLIQQIDVYVTQLIHDIIKAKKIPIVIGGGYYTAYSLIKGSALALNKKTNAINLYAYTKSKASTDGERNTFSRAFTEGFLNRYFIFGIHENYANQLFLNRIKRLKKHIKYNTFESIFVRQELKFKTEINKARDFVCDDIYGIEIDCDAIEGTSKDSIKPFGIPVNKSRLFVSKIAQDKNVGYIHFGKTTPNSNKKGIGKTAKLISCLITDFLRSNRI